MIPVIPWIIYYLMTHGNSSDDTHYSFGAD